MEEDEDNVNKVLFAVETYIIIVTLQGIIVMQSLFFSIKIVGV